MWCAMCSPRYSVHGRMPYLSCFVCVNSVLFCFQITATCARNTLTNPKQRFIPFTMMMLHTASVAKLAWMCTSWQTGRLFHATGARWGLMSHSVNRQIYTATLGFYILWICFFPSSVPVFVSPAKTSRTTTLSLLECLCLLSLSYNCIFRKYSINWHVGFLKDLWLETQKNIDFLL